MSPDELRALADALDKITPVMGLEELHHMETLDRAADYLRACAEAKRDWVAIDTAIREYLYDYEMFGEDDAGTDCCYTPTERECDLIYDAINGLLADEHFMRLIAPHPAPAAPHYAMLDSHRRLVEQAIQSAEHPSGMSTHDGKARIDASVLRRMLAIIDSSPAAPQADAKPADRCRSSETPSSKATSAASPERQALNLEDAAAQVAAGSGEQAEPKREPWSGYEEGHRAGYALALTERDPLRDALKTVIYELAALIPNPDKTLVDDWPCENAADQQCLQIAYTTAREALHGIGGSDER